MINDVCDDVSARHSKMAEVTRVEREKVRQREIIDEVLNCSTESSTPHPPCDPFPREQNQVGDCEGEKGNTGGVRDLKDLFSGRQHSFLADGSKAIGEYGGLISRQVEPFVKSRMVEVSGDVQEKSYFFFHWSNPELANRLECSFHTSRGREELERAWPDRRSAMKKLLRHSHHHALKTARQRKRTQQKT